MKLHEYQAKGIFREYGIPVPTGKLCTQVDSIQDALDELGGNVWVVKAQIHAGGRGKGGGVRVVKSPEEAKTAAEEILSKPLVTPQTGPEGRTVRRLLIEEGVAIAKELYFSILLDRESKMPMIIASAAGGMEIEEVAEKEPEKVLREIINPALGIRSYQTRRLAKILGLEGPQTKQFGKMLQSLYKAFLQEDSSLLEINPLIVTEGGDLIALDAKMQIEDNALFRHPKTVELRDTDEEEPLEVEASKADVNYIKLDGDIGCMVNGAGLAMATMDIIQYVGGSPANFLDVGGGASAESVEQALRIILADPNVKGILINIFGGIVRCDRVAQGVIEGAKRVELNVPVVVRLEGTNAEEAREMLNNADIDFSVAKSLNEAAEKIVSIVKS